MPDLRAAQSIHLKLAAACPYHAHWEVPQAAGPRALRARGKNRNMTAVSMFTWTVSTRGTAACFYLAAARAADLPLRKFRYLSYAEGHSGSGG